VKNVKYKEIVKDVNEILAQYDMLLTLRQVYYRLVAKLLIPNTVTAYKTLSKMLVKAREQGEVDDTRIEDRSRQVLGIGDFGYDDFDGFLDERIERLKDSWKYWARLMWSSQPRNVLVALEKDALSRLFVDVADDFHVHVYPTRGYSSYTYVKNMAGNMDAEKPTVVLYFGDLDPSGRDIERDLGERLGAYGAEHFTVKRIALTEEQITRYDLPPRPKDAATMEKLQRDPRTKTYGMEYAAELDALEPPTLQDLIRKAIQEQIDTGEWNSRLEQIRKEQQKLKEKLGKLKIEWEESGDLEDKGGEVEMEKQKVYVFLNFPDLKDFIKYMMDEGIHEYGIVQRKEPSVKEPFFAAFFFRVTARDEINRLIIVCDNPIWKGYTFNIDDERYKGLKVGVLGKIKKAFAEKHFVFRAIDAEYQLGMGST